MAGIINDVFEGLAVNVTSTVTAGNGLIATAGGVNAQGNSGINTAVSATNTTNIGTGSTAAITIGNVNTLGLLRIVAGAGGMTIDTSGGGALLIGGNVSQGAITINSRTSALSLSNDAFATTVNIATGAGAKTVTLGSTTTTSTTNIQSGSGGINLTGAVFSANAITITSGNLTLTSGNLAITAATTSAVGQITQAGTPILHTMGGTSNIFVGSGAGNLTLTATNSVGIGNLALSSLTSGGSNTAVGVGALDDITTGVRNTAVGYLALENNTSNNNTAVGVQAMQGAAASTAESNVAIGYLAMRLATSCIWNNAIGSQSLENVTTGSENVAVGQGSLGTITTGNYNVGVGFSAGNGLTVANSSNICINANGTAGDNNTLRIGNGAGAGNQQLNRAFIHGIRSITSGSTNRYPVNIDANGQFDGSGNLYLPTTSSTVGQIFVNNLRFAHNYLVTNTFLGADVGNFTMTGTQNVGIGTSAMATLTSGTRNTGVGWGTLFALTTGTDNTAVGNAALTATSTASFNTMIGSFAGTSLTTSGDANTGIGYSALRNITTGQLNSTLGQDSGRNLTGTDSSNIMINNAGTAGDNNTLRIGAGAGTGNQQLNRAFIHGIRGITTGNADALPVLVDSAGQLGTLSSSIRYKENIHDMGLASNMLLYLRPVAFNYKSDEHKTKQFGLIAEEVQDIMSELVVKDKEGIPESVKYQDLPVLLLNEFQKLEKRVRELEKEVRGEY